MLKTSQPSTVQDKHINFIKKSVYYCSFQLLSFSFLTAQNYDHRQQDTLLAQKTENIVSVHKKKKSDQVAERKNIQKNMLNPSENWKDALEVFKLTYEISLSGIPCGNMTFDLVRESKDSPFYRAQQFWNSQIFFFHLDQSEISLFSRNDQQIKPSSYTFKRDKSGDKKLYTYFFDTTNTSEEKSDRLTLQLWLINHLIEDLNSLQSQEIYIVDDRGEVKIFPKIEQKNQKISVQFDFKGRFHQIVFDKSLHYLPISFTQRRGALTFQGDLIEHEINLSAWWHNSEIKEHKIVQNLESELE